MEDPTLSAKHIDKKPRITTEDELGRYLESLGPLKPEAIDIRKDLKDAVGRGDLTRAITLLVQSLDAKQKINWVPCPPFKGKRVILRDARACIPPPEFSTEPFVMMGLNNARATLDLLDIAIRSREGDSALLAKAAQYVKDISYTFYFLASNSQGVEHAMDCMIHFNSVLATHLANALNIKYEQAIERLTVAKEFANLKDPSKHIVTLVNLENAKQGKRTVFEADIALTDLTQDLRDEYNHRAEKDWYKSLPQWQQQLVDYYKDILIEGRVLPTQLRSVLVGLRNSYVAINGAITPEGVEILSSGYHSGTLAYLHKNEKVAKRISQLNIEQLFAHTLEAKLLALTLNTDANPIGNDKDIVSLTKSAMASLPGGVYANLPMNAARRFTSNHYEGIQEFLQLVNDTVFNEIRDRYHLLKPKEDGIIFFHQVQAYLFGETKLENEKEDVVTIFNELEKIKAFLLKEPGADAQEISKKCEIISLALCICLLKNNNKSLSDPDNRNLTLGCLINALASELRAYFNVAINSSCESGKDRTGILMFRMAAVTFNNYLLDQWGLFAKQSELQSIIHKNLIMLATAGHQQLLAGFQTACGTMGIKKDSRGALPENEFPKAVTELLIRETASFNKEIRHNIDLAERFIFPIGDQNLQLQKERLYYIATVLLNHCQSSILPIFDYSEHERLILIRLIKNLKGDLKPGPKENHTFTSFQSLYDFAHLLCQDLNEHVKGKGHVYPSLAAFSDTLRRLALQEQPAPAPAYAP